MNNIDKLYHYFSGTRDVPFGKKVGIEIETQFIQSGTSVPARLDQTQSVFRLLCEKSSWIVVERKGDLVTKIGDPQTGNEVFYELGRHNLELCTRPEKASLVMCSAFCALQEMYSVGEKCGVEPFCKAILPFSQDYNLLVIPDERDAQWLEFDGYGALNQLAATSSVQFTFDVSPDNAICIINTLNRHREVFLDSFPQDEIWKKYIAQSKADYRESRYGGPSYFKDLKDYCEQLAKHAVVQNGTLVPFEQIEDLDIPLFLRSVWWHFRLKRYEETLCIEVRPQGRMRDVNIMIDQHRIILDIIRVCLI